MPREHEDWVRQLYLAHAPDLYRAARYRLQDPELAYNLTQEVSTKKSAGVWAFPRPPAAPGSPGPGRARTQTPSGPFWTSWTGKRAGQPLTPRRAGVSSRPAGRPNGAGWAATPWFWPLFWCVWQWRGRRWR